jgi:hypothetical protein
MVRDEAGAREQLTLLLRPNGVRQPPPCGYGSVDRHLREAQADGRKSQRQGGRLHPASPARASRTKETLSTPLPLHYHIVIGNQFVHLDARVLRRIRKQEAQRGQTRFRSLYHWPAVQTEQSTGAFKPMLHPGSPLPVSPSLVAAGFAG